MDPLDRIRPVGGCSKDWNEMSGDDKARHCAQCRKTVHHLSAMTPSEARAVLTAGQEKPCIAFSVDPRGKLITRPEPTLFARGLAWLRGSLTFGFGLLLAGCAASTPPPPEPPVTASRCSPPSAKDSASPMYIGDMGFNYVESPSVPPEKQGTKH